MTATDVTGFDAISPLDFSLLSPDFRGLVLLNYTQILEKMEKSSGEAPVETAPRNCRFLSLVVVELVLSIEPKSFVLQMCHPKRERRGGVSSVLWVETLWVQLSRYGVLLCPISPNSIDPLQTTLSNQISGRSDP